MLADRSRGVSGFWRRVLVLAAVAGLLSVACIRGGGALPEQPRFNSFLGASEFVVGENRFPFALASAEGEPLAEAPVSVDFYRLDGESWEYGFTLPTEYREVSGVTPHLHDDRSVHRHLDVRGQYVAEGASFPVSGVWQARISVTGGGEAGASVGRLAFNVLAQPAAPGVGEPAPTMGRVEAGSVGDGPASVAEALAMGRPFMVVWSSPMFCTSMICGPVLDGAQAVQSRYAEVISLVHLEPWDLATARERGRLVPVPDFLAWGLQTEPWVFIVDEDGRIAARFEGLVSEPELERAVAGVAGRRAGKGAPFPLLSSG